MSPDPWQVIPTKWIEAAFKRWEARKDQPRGRMTVMGLDIAHGGKDQTVVAARYGDFIDRLRKKPGRETPDGITAAQFAMETYQAGAHINVDVIGYGASAHERLRDAPPEGFGVETNAINFACGSEHRDKSRKYKMINLRAEAYWRLREELDPEREGGATLCLPPDPELKHELCESRYEVMPSGIKIEPKSEIIERLGHSPDVADAVVMTCLPNGQPHGVTVTGALPAMATRPPTALPRPSLGIPGFMG